MDGNSKTYLVGHNEGLIADSDVSGSNSFPVSIQFNTEVRLNDASVNISNKFKVLAL